MMNFTPLMISSFEPTSPLMTHPGEESVTDRPGWLYWSL